ncbi:MAG: zinc-binding alcohol dehydrogenase [Planctomycetota bacterium]
MHEPRTTLAYWVQAPQIGALQAQALPEPRSGEVELRALYSGISPGTERLVGRGLVPADKTAMACRGMQGSFALPVLYGYSLVGEVQSGAERGRRAFVMHPHQQRIVIPEDRLVWLPDGVPSARATLLPNLETAWNASYDAELDGNERIAVFGAGAIGLLVAFVLSTRHRGEVVVIEAKEQRRQAAARLPWVHSVYEPGGQTGEFAVAFHATGTGEGLQQALDCTGFEGRVIELCWYGSKAVTLQLGGSFHFQRKRLISSQVAAIAPSQRARGPAVRMAAVLQLLHDERLDALLEPPVPFARLPEFFARLYRGETSQPCPLVVY